MPQLRSKYFGEMEYAPDAVFHFPEGIPGFESRREFVFLDRPHTKPLVFMQSLDDPGLCFIAIPVTVACTDYRMRLTPEDFEALKLDPSATPRIGTECLCLGLVTVTEGTGPTVNLASPVVLNLLNRRGVQSIRDDIDYSFQHPLTSAEAGITC